MKDEDGAGIKAIVSISSNGINSEKNDGVNDV
jgi:hypothetical protein